MSKRARRCRTSAKVTEGPRLSPRYIYVEGGYCAMVSDFQITPSNYVTDKMVTLQREKGEKTSKIKRFEENAKFNKPVYFVVTWKIMRKAFCLWRKLFRVFSKSTLLSLEDSEGEAALQKDPKDLIYNIQNACYKKYIQFNV